MEKKKNRKKKSNKIAEKAKAGEKAKALKAKLNEKSKKEKVKLKEKARKEKSKDKAKTKTKDKVKDKVKVKKAKAKGKNPEPAASPETGKDKRGIPGRAVSESKMSGTSSLSVNARTAVSKIRSLGKIEAINNYIAGDERVTVKEAATSKITSLSVK